MKNKPIIELNDSTESLNKLRSNFVYNDFKEIQNEIQCGHYAVDDYDLDIDFTDESSQCKEISEYTFELKDGHKIVITNLQINFDYYTDEGDYFHPPSTDVIIRDITFDDYMWLENDDYEMEFYNLDLLLEIRDNLKDLFE